MSIAPPTEVPSERFVEQMGNHFLMNLIGANHAYFHIPTQAAEAALGYDSSLQGFKTLVIQYKRLVPNVPTYTGRIPIDTTQLANLQTKFPPAHQPYAFIGFCEHQAYNTIRPLFSAGTGSLLGNRIIFLDIHSPTLAGRPHKNSINSSLVGPVLGTEAFKLPDLANKFVACGVGLFQADSPETQLRVAESEIRSFGNLSLLHAKLPGWTSKNSFKPTPLRGAA
ncbi:hypothetical protein [Xanthomonas hortorum]|uniref:Uncharacterized protein n=1 Tax=Xanthomonas hortorum pv. gardneri TaxID=2754056 RepID=A0A6V7BEE7_9XANT|nr:hypothetical protein [Xanthomonas hortorum]APP78598.1 hypothetical protein BJD10_01720 [Xanthomonas hortorum pv. gardneri]EGD17808.1 hypothetical protein XGA_3603 [Xanthomonas hortorum ATCC 19865]MCC8497079.1 hypothetical protein [Xanthomonas hortorum pv. gardneri]MCC8506332.1 hypothetical protein [Xanthomonas hortorum pv. gardneri]MCC8512941.1 hypothetical protein [Xanthomonas hortorum pv. gardneri]